MKERRKMKKIVLTFLVVVLPFVPITAQQKYALVIGNSAYRDNPLTNPANDAADMKAALEGLGFQVELLTNANLNRIENAAVQFKNKLRVSPNAYGFFFYAGHGIQSQGQNYLIPVDADIRSESFLKERAFNVQILYDELEAAGNELNVIVLDACRNNPFSWSRGGARGLTVVSEQPAGSIIVYATGAGKTAEDGTGRNGLFTGQLLKNLSLDVEIKEVFNRTGLDVLRVSGGEQRPAVYSNFFGQAFLPPNHKGNTVILDPDPGPRPNPGPSNTVLGGTWNTTLTYSDGNQNYRDIYNIVLLDDSTCIVTIRTQQNGREIQQDADGYWYISNDDIFHLDCDFTNPLIPRLGSVKWTSVYTLENNNQQFRLLVNPAPGVRNAVRIILNKAR